MPIYRQASEFGRQSLAATAGDVIRDSAFNTCNAAHAFRWCSTRATRAPENQKSGLAASGSGTSPWLKKSPLFSLHVAVESGAFSTRRHRCTADQGIVKAPGSST